MRGCISVLLLSVMALASSYASSEEEVLSPTLLRATNNFAHEHATCVAYYAISAKCLASNGNDELQEKTSSIAIEAIKRGKDWTRTAKLKPETFTARIEMEAQQMRESMDGECRNISIILAKHAMSCKLLLESPQKRVKALMEELDAAENPWR